MRKLAFFRGRGDPLKKRIVGNFFVSLFLCRTPCCGDTYDCPGSKGIRRIYNHFVGFGDAAENLGLNSKVAPNFDIPELHYAFRVHYGYLEALRRGI